jgi:hypothetical protein
MTSGTPGSRRVLAVTTGRPDPQVNAPWRRRSAPPEEDGAGSIPLPGSSPWASVFAVGPSCNGIAALWTVIRLPTSDPDPLELASTSTAGQDLDVWLLGSNGRGTGRLGRWVELRSVVVGALL